MAFLLSPVLDNLTTALVMGAVVFVSGRWQTRVHCAGLYQHGRCRERRRRVQSIR